MRRTRFTVEHLTLVLFVLLVLVAVAAFVRSVGVGIAAIVLAVVVLIFSLGRRIVHMRYRSYRNGPSR